MKKIVSLAIMLIIIVSSLTFSFNVQAKYYGDYNCETLKDGTLRIVMYYGEKEKLTIPKELGGKKVTEIGTGAFETAEGKDNVEMNNYTTYELESLSIVKNNNKTRFLISCNKTIGTDFEEFDGIDEIKNASKFLK